MIEAFEIGVSLALRDGVSDGIAAARRDLALIETAIRHNGVSLEALRRAGNRVLETTRKARPDRRLEDGISRGVGLPRDTYTKRVDPVSKGAPEDVQTKPLSHTEPEPGPRMPDLSATGRSLSQRLSAQRSTERTPPTPPAQALLAPTAPAWPIAGHAAAKPISARATSVPHYGAQPGTPPVLRAAAPPRMPTSVAPSDTPVAPNGAMAPLRVQIGLPHLPATMHAQPSVKGADGIAPTASVARVAARTAEAGMGGAAPAQPATAPAGLVAGRLPIPAANDPDDRDATGAGDRSSGDTAPVQGDVFLDGVLVGRWMCRFLARQAGRDPAGPTGFDPRRNPVLPGATIGLS